MSSVGRRKRVLLRRIFYEVCYFFCLMDHFLSSIYHYHHYINHYFVHSHDLSKAKKNRLEVLELVLFNREPRQNAKLIVLRMHGCLGICIPWYTYLDLRVLMSLVSTTTKVLEGLNKGAKEQINVVMTLQLSWTLIWWCVEGAIKDH